MTDTEGAEPLLGDTRYRHPEAFCIMRYRCERCKRSEFLWNSRDGVTPFMLGCRVCGGSMQHVDWDADRRVVDYQVPPGARFFRDSTEDEVFAAYRKRIPQYSDERVREIVRQEVKQQGEPHPWVDTVPGGDPVVQQTWRTSGRHG